MTDAERKRLDGLIPEVRAAFIQLVALCAAKGIRLFLGSTRRDRKQQQQAFDEGKSTLTLGYHNIGRALDVYPYLGDQPDMNGRNIAQFRVMHQLAVEVGLSGLAFNADGTKRYLKTKKGKKWDGAHLEWRQGYASLKEALEVEGPKFGLA